MEETEGARFWLKVFNDLKARGLADILILCGDGLAGLREVVTSAYAHADVQLCAVHQVRNSTKFVSFKDRRLFCADMRETPRLRSGKLLVETLTIVAWLPKFQYKSRSNFRLGSLSSQ